MGKSAGSPPPAPDPTTVANAQTAANTTAARTAANLNRVNSYSPLGSTVYSPATTAPWDEASYLAANPDVAQAIQSGGFQGNGLTHYEKFGRAEGRSGVAEGYMPVEDRWQQTTTLDPRVQEMLNKVLGTAGQSVDLSGLPSVGALSFDGLPEASLGDRDHYEAALMGRINPQLDRQREGIDVQLRNQGLQPGTEAWQAAMDDWNRGANDARFAAVGAAGDEAQRDWARGMGTRQQAVNERTASYNASVGNRERALSEMLQSRSVPMNELLALAGMSPLASGGGGGGAGQVNVQPADVQSAYGAQQAGQMAQYNAKAQTASSNNQTAAAGVAAAATIAAAVIA